MFNVQAVVINYALSIFETFQLISCITDTAKISSYIVFFLLYISHGGKIKCEIYITATCHKYILFELQYVLQLLMKLSVLRIEWPCIHFHKHVSANDTILA